MTETLTQWAASLLRDNIDLRTDEGAAVAALMRVSGAAQHDALRAVRTANAALDKEDAADWRAMQARTKAGKPLFDDDQ